MGSRAMQRLTESPFGKEVERVSVDSICELPLVLASLLEELFGHRPKVTSERCIFSYRDRTLGY